MTQPAAALPWVTRAAAVVRNAADAVRTGTGWSLLNQADAARWRSARTMTDLGGLVIDWLNGQVTRTPGHCAPPCDETLPLIPELTRINRGGHFVTENSQLAESMDGRTWNAYVDGFATDQGLARIREAAAGTGLTVTACRGNSHECGHRPVVRPCPRKNCTDFWATACPDAADVLWSTWWVHVEDPEPGRNNLLWPVLAAALG